MRPDSRMWELIQVARAGGGVSRFHTIPTIRSDTVASHTYGVLSLACAFVNAGALGEKPDPRKVSALLQAILIHDLAEQSTGDVPGPAKWGNPEFKRAMDREEALFEGRFLLHPQHLTDLDQETQQELELILKWSDYGDGVLFCLEELALGNRGMSIVLARWLIQMVKLPSLRTPSGWDASISDRFVTIVHDEHQRLMSGCSDRETDAARNMLVDGGVFSFVWEIESASVSADEAIFPELLPRLMVWESIGKTSD